MCVLQVWDIRTKANVHTLTGHTNTVATVKCQSVEPQIITGEHPLLFLHPPLLVAVCVQMMVMRYVTIHITRMWSGYV